jgi:AraC-like DNA-binding protein
MQAKYEDLRVRKGTESFRAFRRVAPGFEFNWHYHPEFEITLIEKGNGIRLVGDSYQHFEPGDLVMIGKGLPHTWATDKLVKGTSSAVVIQFNEEILESLLALSDFESIKNLLIRARLGLFFPRRNNHRLAALIEQVPEKTGVQKMVQLIHILNILAQQRPLVLASVYFQAVKGELNEKRITRVYQFIQKNSAGRISLAEGAKLIHLSESAFCKFFKRATGKTFSDYVNEIRIGHTCHMLSETDKSISDICYDSGFESLTYFNRIFLKKKGIRPREFRKRNN